MRLTDVYLFQCDGGDLWALSVDQTGRNLPRSACKTGWLLHDLLTAADLIDAEYAQALAATAEQGFCIFRRAGTAATNEL
jgi:hypothetical protein